jgi:DNA mismatch repair protein MSH6
LQLKLDRELLAQQRFAVDSPMDASASLLLDGQTLQNLEVLRNNTDGSTDGTLLALLNQAVSPFGILALAS